MPVSAPIDPVDFDEAIAAFRQRVVVSKTTWQRMQASAKRHAFFVSDVAQADVVHDVWKAIDRAIAKGTTLEDFKKEVGAKLIDAWAGSVDDPAWRLETIFRTNLQQAYAQGRYRQQQDQTIKSLRPYGMFDAILDGRETKVCREADGTILPLDDPWWGEHTPPCHFNCRSGTISLSEEQAKELGGQTPKPTTTPPATGFGLIPGADPPPPVRVYPAPIETARTAKAKKAPPAPPPPVVGIQEGIHTQKVASSLSKKEQAKILRSIADEGTLAFLEKQPLKELRVPATAKSRGKSVNGWWAYDGRLEITGKRKPGTFGQAWMPGASWSIPSSATDAEDARARTLRHELGHHISLIDGDSVISALVTKAYRDPKARPVTRYASTSSDEYFAESYAAYLFHREDLKKHDPIGFDMVEAVLRKRGILPP